MDDFDIVEETADQPKQVDVPAAKGEVKAAIGQVRGALPKFSYAKSGEIEATVLNVKLAIERFDLVGWDIKFDVFRHEIMRHDGVKWAQFTDPDYMRLRYKLKKLGFKEVGRELIRDVVAEVADTNRFDSAIAWLESLPQWDGVSRIDRFLIDYMGAENTAYIRAVGAYMWSGMAGRVLQPGCKADMVPILKGKQGIRKSTAVAALVPVPELFCEISFGEKDDDLARKMRGCLVAEIGELKGLYSRDLETIKAFIVRRFENWIPKFKEFRTTFPRRLIFIGTTNQSEFLADDTGNRRWLPVEVVAANVEAIECDRNQLWAEARDRFKASGVAWREAETLAAAVHDLYMVYDAWEEVIEDWLHRPDIDGKKPVDSEFLLISDILRDALNFDVSHIKKADEMRVGKILKKFEYEKRRLRVNGKRKSVWVSDGLSLV